MVGEFLGKCKILVQIEKTEKNNLQKNVGKSLFTFYHSEKKLLLNLIQPLTAC